MCCSRVIIEKYFSNEEMTPLPLHILAPLCLLNFLGEITLSMCYAYSPEMVKVFGIKEVDTGYYVGILGFVFYMARALSAPLWGYFGDKYGHKPTLIVASFTLTISTFLLAFSVTYYMALTGRLLVGLSMGIAAVCKSLISKKTDDTNVTFAFSIFYSTWPISNVIGPSIAGYLAFPSTHYPHTFGAFFARFGLFLPHIIIGCSLILTVILECHFIPSESTSEDSCKLSKHEVTQDIRESDELTEQCNENRSLLQSERSQNTILENLVTLAKSKEFVICLVLYFIIGSSNSAIQEMFPVFAATERRYHGLQLHTSQIGTILLSSGAVLFIMQVFFIHRITRFAGPRRTIFWTSICYMIAIPAIPTLYVYPKSVAIVTSVLLMGLIVSLQGTNVTLINVILNNLTVDETKGVGNGIGLIASASGRGMATLVYGRLFSWSLRNVQGVESNTTPLGFPFNQYFIFFLLSCAMLLSGVMNLCCLTSDVDKPVRK